MDEYRVLTLFCLLLSLDLKLACHDTGMTTTTDKFTNRNTQFSSSSQKTTRKREKVLNDSHLHTSCDLPWMYQDENGACKCGKTPNDFLRCIPAKEVMVLNCHCITFSEGLTEAGRCMHSCGKHEKGDTNINYHVFHSDKNLTESMCGAFNRNGTLCGKCKDGLYPLAYSFDMTCTECNFNWWRYILAAFLPLTIFSFIIILFKINATSSHLHGFVYYSQVMSMPVLARMLFQITRTQPKVQAFIRSLLLLYGVWNFDFFRSMNLGICIGTDTLQTLALDFAVCIYPLLLALLTYLLITLYDLNFRPLVIIWKPFRTFLCHFCRNWEIKTSIIDAYATFFLLTNVKCLSVSFDLLVPAKVYQLNSTGHFTHSWRLYYDATVPYFGTRHLPYAIIAIAVLVLFVLLPVLLLILYPFRWFQKLLNLFPVRWYILHTFMDSFQGCYKDGTEPGTSDCRWFASVLFLARPLAFVIGAFTLNLTYYSTTTMLIVSISIILINIEPYKDSFRHHNNTTVIFLLLLALWYVCVLGIHYQRKSRLFLGCAMIVTTLPLLYPPALILNWMCRQRIGLRLIRRLHAWRHGYEILE